MKIEIDVREIKIQPQYRRNSLINDKIVPSLLLCGNWLERAGFYPGDHVKIIVQDGLLVIQKDKSK